MGKEEEKKNRDPRGSDRSGAHGSGTGCGKQPGFNVEAGDLSAGNMGVRRENSVRLPLLSARALHVLTEMRRQEAGQI